jgi:PhoPQ-activated pathogenicity-related protein/creatinine amidohydrolase/Fe(II)-dependent formamide hydrolase-like protein
MKLKYKFVTMVLIFIVAQFAVGTPLDDYVKAPDENYRYSVVNTIKGVGYTAYVLDMTSQSWRSKDEVDKTLWKHWLTIIKPDRATANKALLWIGGGSNDRPAPAKAESMVAGVAVLTNTVVAELRMVPNQPLNFPDGERPRYEDAIIAYTFNKYIETGDSTWPLLLPMVKSAVRAMDTIHSHILSVSNGKLDINEFVVSGGSKRGWTTWLTAAVDKRVIAIIPAVIDVLNMAEQMKHHFSAYGFYSSAIEDYEDFNIFSRLDIPGGKKLRGFIDPYEYRSRYTMPKFLVNSSGDQFFVSDSAQFYFHDLPGPKYLRYIPNTDHGLNEDAVGSLTAFYGAILKGSPLPKYSWKVRDDGAIEVDTKTAPMAVKLWRATNEKARDFRLETIGAVWESTDLGARGAGRYVGKVGEPEKGWTAFFVELTFDSGGPMPHKFTTEIKVVPETLPFADKLKKVSKAAEGVASRLSTEKVLYAELTPKEFRERIAAAPIAYLPLGTLEWHGEHLPIGSDGLQSYGFFIELAQRAGGIVLPMLFLGPDRMEEVDGKELYGMDTLGEGMVEERRYKNQQLTGSAYWVPEETFRVIIEATLKQLRRAGFRIVVAHGHGPSTGFFRGHAKEWKEKFGLETFVCWGSKYDRQGMGIQVDHAAMNETSLVMALRPELVKMERLSKERWPVGISGRDPRKFASAKLGREIIKLQTERMAKILKNALAKLNK